MKIYYKHLQSYLEHTVSTRGECMNMESKEEALFRSEAKKCNSHLKQSDGLGCWRMIDHPWDNDNK